MTAFPLRRIASLLVLAAPVAAQEAPPAPDHVVDGLVSDDAGCVRIPVPDGWRVTERKTAALSDEPSSTSAVLEFTAEVPGVEGSLDFMVCVMNGCPASERLQVLRERRKKIDTKEADADTYEVGLEPFAHGQYVRRGSPEESTLIVYRRIAGRTLGLVCEVPTTAFTQLRPLLLEMAGGMLTEWEMWPAPPDVKDIESVEGFVLAFDPRVAAAERRDVTRLVKSTVEQFRRGHGDPFVLRGEEPVILVSVDPDANAAFVAEDDEDRAGSLSNYGMRRIATLPLYRETRGKRANFVRLVYGYLAYTLYPDDFGTWIQWGEARMAYLAERTGRKLPFVPSDWMRPLEVVRIDLKELAKKAPSVGSDEYAGWTIFFRYGPAKYAKPYAAFLEEMRYTLHPEAAFDRNFGGFDPRELRQDATRFLREELRAFDPK